MEQESERMIICEKCNCCVHEQICSFKQEYLDACEAVKYASYTVGKEKNGAVGLKYLKDSKISVSIRCPYIMTQSAVRGANNG